MILVVTSLVGGAGRSTVSRGLAASLARAGANVAWVGADLAGGPDGEGVDAGLAATADALATSTPRSAVLRVGAVDHDDLAWARARSRTTDDPAWKTILERLDAERDLVVVDAPRLFDAGHLFTHADRVLVLVPLDRPAPPTLEPIVQELDRARTTNAKLRLDGVVLTRLDAPRPSVARELDALLTLAPARAFWSPFVPEGAGLSREGAIEELATVWARRAGITLRARPRATSGGEARA